MPVDTDGDLDELSAVLVPHVDAVLAGVIGSDLVDDEAGKLAAVKRDLGVLGGGDFLLILEPGDLGGRLAPHGAGQAQRLQRVESQVNNRIQFKVDIKVRNPSLSPRQTRSVWLVLNLWIGPPKGVVRLILGFARWVRG